MSLDYDQNFLQDHLLSDFDWGNAAKKEEDCFELPMSHLMSDVSDDWLDPCGVNLHLSLDSPPLTPEDHEDGSLQHPVFPLDLDGDLESFQYSVMNTNILDNCSMSYQDVKMTSSFLTTHTNTTSNTRNDDITLALIKATQDAELSTAGNLQSTINYAEIDFESLSVPSPVIAKPPPVKVRRSKAVHRNLNFTAAQSAKDNKKHGEEPDRLKKVSEDMAKTAQETKRLLKLYGVDDESSSFRATGKPISVNGVVGGGTKRVGSRIATRFESPKKSCSLITTTPLKQLPLVKLKRVTKQQQHQPVITTPTSTVFAMTAKNTIQIPISSVSSSVNGNPPPCSSIVNLTTTNNNGVKSYIVAGPQQQSNKNIHPILHLPTATGCSGKMITSSNDVPLLSVITHSDPSKPKLVSTVDRRVSTIKIEPGVKSVFLLPQNPKIAIVKQPTSISPPPTNINDAGANTEQQMFKLVTNNSQSCTKPVVLSNYVLNNNTTTNVDQDSARSKPLMGSLGGRMQPIVPAPIPLEPSVVNNTATLTLSQLQSPKPVELKVESCSDIDRMYKRQQRMIKNRESASQSRQRRKQHVMDLEQQLEEMKNENFKLRLENKRLQDENRSFRHLLSGKNISIDPKKKSLVVLSLLLFMTFTFTSFSSPFAPVTNNMRGPGGGAMDHNLPVIIDSASADSSLLHHSSRQLLAFGESYQDSSANVSSGKKEESSDVGRTNAAGGGGNREEFWIDDMVKNYKKESLERILELLRGTSSSVPLQRLLRRKLKEELGIRVPLFPAKLRRISSQTPPRSTTTPVTSSSSPTSSSRISTQSSAYQSFEQEKVKMPPSPPITREASGFDEEQNFPCGHQQMNKTETSRLNSRLDWWISHHEVNRHRQKGDEKTTAQKKPKRKRKARRKRSTVKLQVSAQLAPRKENGLAVYTKKNDMNSFWEAFGRQNDTIYVISMRKDQMLLPPLVRNLSSKTKLSLLLSAAPPNDTFANEDGFMTMIKIDCEVNSSDYLRIRRDILPKDFDKYSSYHRNSKHDSGEGNNVDHGGHVDAGEMFTALTYNEDEDTTVTDATAAPLDEP